VNLRYDGSTLPCGRRNPLGRARPHIADSEDAGPAGLKRQDRAGIGVNPASAIGPGDHEPFVVHRDAAIEPGGVRVGANEQEEVTQGTGVGGPSRVLSH
jgi:hypothetical protein